MNKSIRSISFRPVTYLMLQVGLLFAVFATVFPSRVTEGGDSVAYLTYSFSGLRDILSQFQTVGYPAFLSLVRLISPDLELLPYVQFLIYGFGVYFFWKSLVVYGLSEWLALVAASALLYQRLLWEWSPFIYNDVPTAALSTIVSGFVFRIAARPGDLVSWTGLTLSLFLTYLFRPAYQFMIPLVPVLGVVLAVHRDPQTRPRELWKRFLALAAVSVLPVLGFCTARAIAVGHFGLVSRAGFELMGITTQFLDNDVIRSMDEDIQPLAREILRLRESEGLGLPANRDRIPMPYFMRYFFGYGKIHQQAFQTYSWAATGAEKPDRVKTEKIYMRIALSTIRAKPASHAAYYVRSFFYAISFTLYANATVSVLAMVLFCLHVWGATRHVISNVHPAHPTNPLADDWRELGALISFSGFYYIAKLLVAIAVIPPLGRALMAASSFICSCLAAAIYLKAKTIASTARSAQGG